MKRTCSNGCIYHVPGTLPRLVRQWRENGNGFLIAGCMEQVYHQRALSSNPITHSSAARAKRQLPIGVILPPRVVLSQSCCTRARGGYLRTVADTPRVLVPLVRDTWSWGSYSHRRARCRCTLRRHTYTRYSCLWTIDLVMVP